MRHLAPGTTQGQATTPGHPAPGDTVTSGRPGRRQSRPRRGLGHAVLVGAVLVGAALGLLACSTPVEEFPASPTPASFPGDEVFTAAATEQPVTTTTEAATASSAAAASTTSTTAAEFVPRAYQTGECVTWTPNAGPARTVSVVDCSAPHLLEIAGSVDLAQVFGADRAAYPDSDQWDFVLENRCVPVIERQIGRPLDPTGRLTPYLIKPSMQAWQQGDRALWCAIASRDDRLDVPGDDAALQPFSGRAANIDQTLNFAPGTCLASTATATRPAIVACTAPHLYEVTAVVDLSTRTDRLPATDAWASLMDDACTKATTSYLGRALASTERTFWFQIDETAWDAGRRTTECLAAVVDGNNQPLELSRSLR